MPVLDISSLIPKRDTIDFGNDLVVEIKSWNELHALDMGYIANLQGKAQVLIEAAYENESDSEAQADRMEQLSQLLTKTLCYVMPDVQPEVLDAIDAGVKQKVLNWWRGQRFTEPSDDDPNASGQG